MIVTLRVSYGVKMLRFTVISSYLYKLKSKFNSTHSKGSITSALKIVYSIF